MAEPCYKYSSIRNKTTDIPENTSNNDQTISMNKIHSNNNVKSRSKIIEGNDQHLNEKSPKVAIESKAEEDEERKKSFLGGSFYTNDNAKNTEDFSESVLAPLARLEALDENDDREVVSKPYPGVDDGFFTDNSQENPVDKRPDLDTDVELIPTQPKDPERAYDDYPLIPRAGSDDKDDKDPDENDGFSPPVSKDGPHQFWPKFPVAPGYGFDLENGIGLGSGVGETIPDLNVYQHKKTLAQGMMDLALFSANANQLRYVLETFRNHPYFYPSLILISISLCLQVAVGIGLIWNATYNVKNENDLCRANKINNFTVIAIFLVTVINVFISAFGVAPAPS